MGFDDALRTADTARMSSDRERHLRVGSVRDVEARWEIAQARLARALVAQPSIAIYFRYLTANKLSRAAKALDVTITELVQVTEGLLYEQGEISSVPATARRAIEAVRRTVEAGGDPRSSRINRVHKDVLIYLYKTLRGTRIRTRSQYKGDEAVAVYAVKKKAFLDAWDTFDRLLRRHLRSNWGTPSLARNLAVKTPVTSLETTANMDVPTEKLTPYLSQLMAGLAAVSAMSRDFEYERRLLITPTSAMPAKMTFLLDDDGTDITGIKLSGSRGTDQPPHTAAALGIQVNDVVIFNNEANLNSVASIDGSAIMLDETRPVGTVVHRLEIIPLGYWLWKNVAEDFLTGFLLDEVDLDARKRSLRRRNFLDLYRNMPKEVRRREGRSASQVRSLISFLALLQRRLVLDTSTVDAIVQRLGLDVEVSLNNPIVSTVEGLLKFGIPLPSTDDYYAGRAVIASFADEGFDRADALLREGMIDYVLRMKYSEATFAGAVSTELRGISAGIGQGFFTGRG